MRLFGFTLTREKAAVAPLGLAEWNSGDRGWTPIVREPYANAWQRGVVLNRDSVMTFGAVFACITLIASDVGKLWLSLVERGKDDVWTRTENPAYSPVLREPNHYQTRQQFFEHWIHSKLVHGNTYVLKERDARSVVTSLYVLDPQRVKVLVAPDGSVYYELAADYLSGVEQIVRVPASELIHDRMNALYHPLCGLSPISACGLAATQGLKIQEQSAKLFANGSHPGGIISGPHAISPDAAKRIQEHWDSEFAGEQNIGKVAVLGDGLTYAPMMMTAKDALLVDQLKLSGEMVCTVFHVPNYMIGIGPPPNYNNIQALNLQYYAQCLQPLIEAIENTLDKGLRLPNSLGVQFDLDALLRMDTATAIESATKGIIGGLFKPNEARRKFDLPPVQGGNTVYLQQQQYSLAALDRRDRAAPPPPTTPAPPTDAPDEELDDTAKEFFALLLQKEIAA